MSAEDARSIYFQLLERARQAQPGADPAPGSHAETPAPSTAEELDRLWTARVLLERAQERIKGAVSQGSLDSEGGRELLELIEQRVRDFPAASEEEFGPQPVRDQSGDVSAPPADTVEEPTVRAQHQDATEALENRASAADASGPSCAAVVRETTFGAIDGWKRTLVASAKAFSSSATTAACP